MYVWYDFNFFFTKKEQMNWLVIKYSVKSAIDCSTFHVHLVIVSASYNCLFNYRSGTVNSKSFVGKVLL